MNEEFGDLNTKIVRLLGVKPVAVKEKYHPVSLGTSEVQTYWLERPKREIYVRFHSSPFQCDTLPSTYLFSHYVARNH